MLTRDEIDRDAAGFVKYILLLLNIVPIYIYIYTSKLRCKVSNDREIRINYNDNNNNIIIRQHRQTKLLASRSGSRDDYGSRRLVWV